MFFDIFNKIDKNKYYKKSFSQCGEDMIINFIFYCLKIELPSYIDIGAHHPYYLSNTAFFYNKGSRGINIEPNLQLINEFNKFRKEDINLNIGISNENSTLVFYRMHPPTMSTFDKEEAYKLNKETGIKLKEEEKIDVKRISDIIDKYCLGKFPDFMNLDVEKLEDKIIKDINFKKSFPKVICIESLTFTENNTERKVLEIIDYLKNEGYFLYADTFINSILVHSETWKNR